MLQRTLLILAGTSALLTAAPAGAENFLGRIILVALPFCPQGSVDADGALLPIAGNERLFALYGTQYGGDGATNFAIPDLRGRVPIHSGQRPGFASYPQGQEGGSETLQLKPENLPSHSHVGVVRAVDAAGTSANPRRAVPADFTAGQRVYNNANAPNATMHAGSARLYPEPTWMPVPNLGPYLAIRYCVMTQGPSPR